MSVTASTINSLAEFIFVDARYSRGMVELPIAGTSVARKLTIKDAYGSFSNSTVQIRCSMNDTFEDNQVVRIFSTNNTSLSFVGLNSKWYTLHDNTSGAGFNSSNLAYNTNSTPYTLDINSIANLSSIVSVNLGTTVAQSNLWVAAGRGSVRLKYSVNNGLTWLNCTENFTSFAHSVAFNGKMWVAVGNGANSIQYSYNGINWSNVSNNFAPTGRDVKWNGQMWVATGNGFPTTKTIKWSMDGIVWNDSITNPINYNNNGAGAGNLSWNGSIWVAGSGWPNGDGNGTVYSYDGKNWIYNSPTARGYGSVSAGWTGEVFLVNDDVYIYYTSNGITWNTDSNWNSALGVPERLATNGNIIVYVGHGGFTTIKYGYNYGEYSNTNYTLPGGGFLQSVEYGNGRFIAVGSNTASIGNNIIYSDDGLNWTAVSGFDNNAFGIAYSSNITPTYSQSNFSFYNHKSHINLQSTNVFYTQPSSIVLNKTIRVDSQTDSVFINTNGGNSAFTLDVNGPMQYGMYTSTVNAGGGLISIDSTCFGVNYNITTPGSYTLAMPGRLGEQHVGKNFTLRNNSGSPLSITVTGASGITSPLSIANYRSATIVVASAVGYALF